MVTDGLKLGVSASAKEVAEGVVGNAAEGTQGQAVVRVVGLFIPVAFKGVFMFGILIR